MPVKLRRKLIVIISFGSGLREAIPAKNRKILPTFAASSSACSFSMALLAWQVVGDGGFLRDVTFWPFMNCNWRILLDYTNYTFYQWGDFVLVTSCNCVTGISGHNGGISVDIPNDPQNWTHQSWTNDDQLGLVTWGSSTWKETLKYLTKYLPIVKSWAAYLYIQRKTARDFSVANSPPSCANTAWNHSYW